MPPAFSEAFDRFWAVWPPTRRVAKRDARKAWAQLNPSESLVEIILEAVQRQRETWDWIKANGEFIPYPATYIRGARWEDEAVIPRAPSRECQHEPLCPNLWSHGQLLRAEATNDPKILASIKSIIDRRRTG